MDFQVHKYPLLSSIPKCTNIQLAKIIVCLTKMKRLSDYFIAKTPHPLQLSRPLYCRSYLQPHLQNARNSLRG